MEPIDTSKFEYVRLPQKETWGILIRQDHELAAKETVTVEDIMQYPLISRGEKMQKNQILHWMQCEERHLNIPAYYNLLSNSALLVEAGMGWAVCLDGALSIHADPELCFPPDLPYAYYKECDPLEEESSVFTGSLLFVQTIQEH